MPLFEIETESHIIITWAADQEAAHAVVHDAYPGEKIMRLTKRPRDTWVISKSAARHLAFQRLVPHGPRLPGQGRRRQSSRHSLVHARNRLGPRAGAQSHRVEHGDGLVAAGRSPTVPPERYPLIEPLDSPRRSREQRTRQPASTDRFVAPRLVGEIQIPIADVGDPDHQHAHPAAGSVDHAGRNMHHRTFAHWVLDTIQAHDPFPVQDVIQLRRDAMVMFASTVDINCVRQAATLSSCRLISKCRQPQVLRSLGRFAFVPHQHRSCRRLRHGHCLVFGSPRSRRRYDSSAEFVQHTSLPAIPPGGGPLFPATKPCSCRLKNACSRHFSTSQYAKQGSARLSNITTYVAILSSHSCDVAAR